MKTIAETAWHHDGDFDFMVDLINQICERTMADYVKIHISLDVDEYMHIDHPAYNAVVEKMFSENQWGQIVDIIISYGKKPMFLTNDKKAIDFCIKYNPEMVEIHSVCLNDVNLLKYADSCLPESTNIVLGVGGSDIYEIEHAINQLRGREIILMHGFQNYPTKYEQINLIKIKKIVNLFPQFKHGYADHTAWNDENNYLVTMLVAANDMQYIEKHVTIEPGTERIDWQAAVSIDLFNNICNSLKVSSLVLGNGDLKLNSGEKSYSIFGPNKKAGILTKDVKAGDEFSAELYSFKRTGQKTDLSQIDLVGLHGKKFVKNLEVGHCIKKSDIE